MQIAEHAIAMCDWCIEAGSVGDAVRCIRGLGLEHVHLALSPLVGSDGLPREHEIVEWKASGLRFTAGMIAFAGEDYSSIESIRRTGGLVPDSEWGSRRRWIESCLGVGSDLGLRMISTHIGFVPGANEPGYSVMIGRVRNVADLFAAYELDLLMETGQERACELVQFLEDVDRPNLGVNFDPGNMILYGAGDPVDAVRTLGHHIRHVHVKDAIGSGQPGIEWGREVPFGTGQAEPGRLMQSLADIGYKNALAIEREAGHDRTEDVRYAIGQLEQALSRLDRGV